MGNRIAEFLFVRHRWLTIATCIAFVCQISDPLVGG